MSHGERAALTGLITALIVIVLFVWLLTVRQAEGTVLGPDGLQVWVRPGLCLVCGSIGIGILVLIELHMAHTRLTGDIPDDRRKERDRDIDRRAMSLGWFFRFTGILGVIIGPAFYQRGA